MNIVETIKTMSAKEIIMTMVNSLKNPLIKINMGTFGTMGSLSEKELCFGCAAAVFLCALAGNDDYIRKGDMGIRNLNLLISETIESGKEIKNQFLILRHFEIAIDHLREGDIFCYNSQASQFGFAEIISNDISLPILYSGFIPDDLKPYEKLAEMQV